ncbi:MAG: insulinase family protein [Bacteroidetes bacterium]|nr:insulinase family protein [Bacteroidota bacterium]
MTIPSPNLETAFWLESDRMFELAFSPLSLDTQRLVVVEEFRQRYLNQPYGDTWLLLRPLAYQVHPYQWATIGKEVAHIEDATLEDVKQFFNDYYHPANAILTLSGDITFERAQQLTEKWFGPIPSKKIVRNLIPIEPAQEGKRTLTIEKAVPYDAIYKSWHCCSRFDAEYYATDLLTDVLSGGKSSRLFNVLVKEKKLFSSISAYMTGDLDPGLVVAEGKLVSGVNMAEAEKALDEEIQKMIEQKVTERELNKVKQKAESGLIFGEMNHDNRALNLAYFEMLGDANLINDQIESYRKVDADQIQKIAKSILKEDNSSVLYYLAKK